MLEANFDVNDFEQANQSRLDEKLLVKFFLKTRPDKAATEKEGRPMFKEVEYISIMVAGSNSGGACRPARQNDIERFPKHYAAFKNRIEAPTEGTPLSEWPVISRTLVEQFAFMNVKTVEQLADLNDTYAGQIMGGHTFKKKAKDFLAYSKDLKEAADKAELIEQNEMLHQQVADLTKRLDALEGKEETAEKPEEPEAEVKTKPKTTAKKKAPAKRKRKTARKTAVKKKKE